MINLPLEGCDVHLLADSDTHSLNFYTYVFRYVDVSTVDGETSKAICSAVREKGAEFLEVRRYFIQELKGP